MKSRLLIIRITLLILISYSCKQREYIPDIDLMTKLINEIILQDSLNTALPISAHLIDYYLFQIKADTNPISLTYPLLPPPPPNRNSSGEDPFSFEEYKILTKFVFNYSVNQLDSVFIIDQISLNKNIILNTNKLIEKIKIENVPFLSYNIREVGEFYFFNTPILNKDKTIAVVEYHHFCLGCGRGKIAFLQKKENEWTLVDSRLTWTN